MEEGNAAGVVLGCTTHRPGGNTDKETPGIARSRHTCRVGGKDHMTITAGINWSTFLLGAVCTAHYLQVHLLCLYVIVNW